MTSESRPAPHARAAANPDPDAVPWMSEGFLAGAIGAAAIAIFFLAVDLANGRPLWTPHALGTALFLGEPSPPDATISPSLVGGYTVIHGWVFVSIGLIASFLLIGVRLPGGGRIGRTVTLALVLFAAFGLAFAAFAALLASWGGLPHGWGRILVANAIAAVGMAWVLVARRDRTGT